MWPPPAPSSFIGGRFSSAGICPPRLAPTVSMMYLPSSPLELAKPCGKRADLEFISPRTLSQAHIHDAGICHGAAGIAHLFHRMARATGDEQLYLAARAWIVETLRMRSNVAIAGYPRVYESGGELRFEEDATLLTGAIGTALVLHAAISEVEPRWDRLLLVDLPEKP